jgi:heterodisulfide reductase subunit B
VKIGYYPGCSLHSTGIEYDMSARAVAKALGIELDEIKDWVCCGSSPAHSSNELMSLALPAKNLLILKEENGLTDLCVPCASCFSRLKAAQNRLEDASIRKRVESVLEAEFPQDIKVTHLMDTMVRGVGLDAIRERVEKPLAGIKVACYYGCLMTRPPKVTGKERYENPSDMEDLMGALGAEAVDWNMKTYCCGASFALTRTDVVLKMTGRVLADAANSGAEAVVVGCPLCHSNLDTRQEEINAAQGAAFRVPVFYFTELMGVAFGIEPAVLGIDRHFTDAGKLLKERGFS